MEIAAAMKDHPRSSALNVFIRRHIGVYPQGRSINKSPKRRYPHSKWITVGSSRRPSWTTRWRVRVRRLSAASPDDCVPPTGRSTDVAYLAAAIGSSDFLDHFVLNHCTDGCGVLCVSPSLDRNRWPSRRTWFTDITFLHGPLPTVKVKGSLTELELRVSMSVRVTGRDCLSTKRSPAPATRCPLSIIAGCDMPSESLSPAPSSFSRHSHHALCRLAASVKDSPGAGFFRESQV